MAKEIPVVNRFGKYFSGNQIACDKTSNGLVYVYTFSPHHFLEKHNALLLGIYLIQEALGLDEMPEECDLISLRERYKELKGASEQGSNSKGKKIK